MKKTVLITGGARGIGFATALQFGREGYNVSIIDLNDPKDYQANLDKLQAENIPFLYMQGDVRIPEDRETIVKDTVDRFGAIHALVNAAGFGTKRMEWLDLPEEEWDRIMDNNAKALCFMTQLVAKQMLKQPIEGGRRGSIVNISSINARSNCPGLGVYGISKAAVSMLTTLFAARLAPDFITVNEVRPFMIATEMALVAKTKYDKMIADGEMPIPRWGEPEDVAAAISAFCMDDRFTFSTGNFVNVDGGYVMPRMK